MLNAKNYLVGALVVAACSVASAGVLSSGVCYSPWHHPSVNNDIVQKDFGQIKQYFSSVRTYHARFSGLNVIDAAAQAGIQVAVGVMMQDKGQIQNEIDAICDGVKRHASTVQAVYVGNENLKNGGFGSFSGAEIIGYINKVKGCVSSYHIPVGSVQRINEWLSAPDAKAVADASDIIGANVYPFFTLGNQKPIEKLIAQWNQLTAKYPENKLHISETGWPRAGGSSNGNAASKDTMQSFLNDFETWSKTKPTSYYFMMYDTTNAYGGQEFEKFFGLANTQGQLQVAIPTGDGTTKAPEGTTAAPATTTPAPTTAAPTTAAPATTTPAPTTASPAGTAKPAETPKPSETQKPAETPKPSETQKPGETPKPAETPAAPGSKPTDPTTPASTSGAATSPVQGDVSGNGGSKDPTPTPAATKHLRKHKHHKNCADTSA